MDGGGGSKGRALESTSGEPGLKIVGEAGLLFVLGLWRWIRQLFHYTDCSFSLHRITSTPGVTSES